MPNKDKFSSAPYHAALSLGTIMEARARDPLFPYAGPTWPTSPLCLHKTGPMIVMGLIEVEEERFFNTAIVVDRGIIAGRYRKVHLLGGEQI